MNRSNKKDHDGSDLTKKIIKLNSGVSFEAGEKVYVQFIIDRWDDVKDSVKDYEFAQKYKDLGAGYEYSGSQYFIYPTFTSFVISKVNFEGFKSI